MWLLAKCDHHFGLRVHFKSHLVPCISTVLQLAVRGFVSAQPTFISLLKTTQGDGAIKVSVRRLLSSFASCNVTGNWGFSGWLETGWAL